MSTLKVIPNWFQVLCTEILHLTNVSFWIFFVVIQAIKYVQVKLYCFQIFILYENLLLFAVHNKHMLTLLKLPHCSTKCKHVHGVVKWKSGTNSCSKLLVVTFHTFSFPSTDICAKYLPPALNCDAIAAFKPPLTHFLTSLFEPPHEVRLKHRKFTVKPTDSVKWCA